MSPIAARRRPSTTITASRERQQRNNGDSSQHGRTEPDAGDSRAGYRPCHDEGVRKPDEQRRQKGGVDAVDRMPDEQWVTRIEHPGERGDPSSPRECLGKPKQADRPERRDDRLHGLNRHDVVARDPPSRGEERRVERLEVGRLHTVERKRAVSEQIAGQLPVHVLERRRRDQQIGEANDRGNSEQADTDDQA